MNTEGEEGAFKFRQITAAYEILGNLKLRKLYDKGLLPREGTPLSDEADEAHQQSRFHRTSRTTRSQPAMGRTNAYDFDEWSRSHYGTAVNRKHTAKNKKEQVDRMRELHKEEDKTDYILMGVFGLCALFLVLNNWSISTNDRVVKPEKKADQ